MICCAPSGCNPRARPDGRLALAAAGALLGSVIACAPGGTGRAGCAEGNAFAADGTLTVAAVPGQPPAGAEAPARRRTRAPQLTGDRSVGALRHAVLEGCERVTIELRSEESAGPGAGEVRAGMLRELGIVRVALPGVRQVETGATDATFEGTLAGAAYAVRAPDGPHVFVDVLLGLPAEARVAETPGAVVVDLRPGGGPIPPPAARSTRVVVLSPRAGEATYPLIVLGYARTFEANVVVRLEQDGAPAVETFTTSTGYVDAWGYYRAMIDQGPRGPVTLHVGEYSARDGLWEGAAVALAMQ